MTIWSWAEIFYRISDYFRTLNQIVFFCESHSPGCEFHSSILHFSVSITVKRRRDLGVSQDDPRWMSIEDNQYCEVHRPFVNPTDRQNVIWLFSAATWTTGTGLLAFLPYSVSDIIFFLDTDFVNIIDRLWIPRIAKTWSDGFRPLQCHGPQEPDCLQVYCNLWRNITLFRVQCFVNVVDHLWIPYTADRWCHDCYWLRGPQESNCLELYCDILKMICTMCLCESQRSSCKNHYPLNSVLL